MKINNPPKIKTKGRQKNPTREKSFLEINETRYLQPTFYASYPTIFSLYPWFFGKKIYFDNEFQSVVFVEQIKNNETLKWNSTIIKESTPVNPLETSTVCWNNMNGNDKK
jgi:hypothetical protein